MPLAVVLQTCLWAMGVPWFYKHAISSSLYHFSILDVPGCRAEPKKMGRVSTWPDKESHLSLLGDMERSQ